MAASQNVPVSQETGDRNAIPVATTKRLFQGAMAFADVSGYATPTPGPIFLGHVTAEADNRTGQNADKSVSLHCGRYRLQVAVPSVALTDVGSPVYATDDNTYALSGVYAVGKVVRKVGTNLAVVEFDAPALAADAGSV